MKFLDDDATEEYTQELLAQEVLDAEYLEQSLRDATAKANWIVTLTPNNSILTLYPYSLELQTPANMV